MKLLYVYRTRGGGEFYLGQSEDGKYHPLLYGESLGEYASLEQAAEDLANGRTTAPDCSTFIEELGIPTELKNWTKV